MKCSLFLFAAVMFGGSVVAELQPAATGDGTGAPIDLTDPARWEGDVAGYAFEDGLITCKPGGVMYTKETFGNLVLSFEFQLTPGANNGIGLFMKPGDERTSVDGIEIQVLDDTAEEYKDIEPWQFHGSIYGIVPAKQGHLKPVGEWNSETVTVKDRRITVVLNGVTIADADLDEATREPTPDGKEHPGAMRTQGRVGFLGHGRVLSYRNVLITPLPSETTDN